MLTDNRATVRRVLLLTLGLNILVFAIKLALGLATGSLSILADALHSITDSASNVLGLVASRLASPYPDREHPYGRQKFEALAALAIAAFLGIACFEILQSAGDRLLEGWQQGIAPLKISSVELWILLIVLGINIFVTFYERRQGLKIGSPILIADAQHTMSDVWVTIAVLAGLIGAWAGEQIGWPQLRWLDVILALPVVLLVFQSGWAVLQENVPWLIDHMAIAPETIQEITLKVPGVISCHRIASRGIVGRQVFIEMHLIVDAQDVSTAHQITEQVEQQLEVKFGPARILIHIEPPNYSSDQLTY